MSVCLSQEAYLCIKGPLTALEKAQIQAGLRYLGKQAKRWDIIVAQYMPYRSATHLSRLWRAHLIGKEPG